MDIIAGSFRAWPNQSEQSDSVVICGTKIFHRGFYWDMRNVIDEQENWGFIIHLPKEDQAMEETV
jgi:hypothetical protein